MDGPTLFYQMASIGDIIRKYIGLMLAAFFASVITQVHCMLLINVNLRSGTLLWDLMIVWKKNVRHCCYSLLANSFVETWSPQASCSWPYGVLSTICCQLLGKFTFRSQGCKAPTQVGFEVHIRLILYDGHFARLCWTLSFWDHWVFGLLWCSPCFAGLPAKKSFLTYAFWRVHIDHLENRG